MKKLISAIIILAIIIGASTYEIIWAKSVYAELHTKLHVLSDRLESNKSDTTATEVSLSMAEVDDFWTGKRKILMAITHHNLVRGVDDKLVSLKNFLITNSYADALNVLELAMNYIHDLGADYVPSITILF